MCVRPTSVMEAGKEEQRSVVQFLTAEGVGGREIIAYLLFTGTQHVVRVYWNNARDSARDVCH